MICDEGPLNSSPKVHRSDSAVSQLHTQSLHEIIPSKRNDSLLSALQSELGVNSFELIAHRRSADSNASILLSVKDGEGEPNESGVGKIEAMPSNHPCCGATHDGQVEVFTTPEDLEDCRSMPRRNDDNILVPELYFWAFRRRAAGPDPVTLHS